MGMMHHVIADRSQNCTPDGAQAARTHHNHASLFICCNICDNVARLHTSLQSKLCFSNLKLFHSLQKMMLMKIRCGMIVHNLPELSFSFCITLCEELRVSKYYEVIAQTAKVSADNHIIYVRARNFRIVKFN